MILVVKLQLKTTVITTNYMMVSNKLRAVQEKIHTQSMEGHWGVSKAKIISSMKLNCNFQRAGEGGSHQKIFLGGGREVWILLEQHCEVTKGTHKLYIHTINQVRGLYWET